jgi:hypothetical protein
VRRPVSFVVGVALAVGALAACSGGSGSGTARYCDVVKVAEAGTDPLADQVIYNDPTRLKAALRVRVQTYTDLAARAPSDISSDASTVRDGIIKVNNALAKHDYQSAAANTDADLQAALNDQAFADATDRLRAFNAKTCVG